jgi:hypothetical protein
MTKGLKMSSEDKAEIEERYRFLMGVAMKREVATLEKFFTGKDRDGFLRHLNSVHKREIPKALRAAIDKALPGRARPVATNGTGKAAPNAAAKPTEGYQWVGTRPSVDQIDLERTQRKDYMEGRAMLKTGKKVAWKVR